LTRSDSCGDCIAGVTSVAARTGLAGSLMSSTATPVGWALSVALAAFLGNSGVVS